MREKMKKEPKNDLRYIKTEKLIQKTFRDMILEMDYTQITIRELTERAKINRKTFYLHYTSLDSLLAVCQTKLYDEFLQSISDIHLPTDLEKLIRHIFTSWNIPDEANRKILYSRGNFPIGKSPGDYARKAIFRLGCSDGYLSKYTTKQIELIDAYLNGIFTFIHYQWETNNREMSFEDVVSLTTQLISHGFLSLDLQV